MTNRERLRGFMELLDSAPFDVRALRAQLEHAMRHLPETEVADVLRQTLGQLARTEWTLSFLNPASLRPGERAARQRAIDWISTARGTLVDHDLN